MTLCYFFFFVSIVIAQTKELTELHHENVVALLDCKVKKTTIYILFFFIKFTKFQFIFFHRNRITMSSLLWSTATAVIWPIIWVVSLYFFFSIHFIIIYVKIEISRFSKGNSVGGHDSCVLEATGRGNEGSTCKGCRAS